MNKKNMQENFELEHTKNSIHWYCDDQKSKTDCCECTEHCYLSKYLVHFEDQEAIILPKEQLQNVLDYLQTYNSQSNAPHFFVDFENQKTMATLINVSKITYVEKFIRGLYQIKE